MNKGGRNRDPIWTNFLEIEEDGRVKAKCKACGHIQSIKACRMRAHVKSCKQQIRSPTNDVTNEIISQEDLLEDQTNIPLVPVPDALNVAKKRKVQSSISNYCCSTTDNNKKELDKLIGMFFYACNVPFSHVESEHFQRLVSKLRPGYNPPTRKSLAGNILDDIHDELQSQMLQNLKRKNVSLIVDGWSNIHNEPITVASLFTEGKTYLVDAVDTGSNPKTTEYLTDLSKEIICTASDKYDCQVKSVVTDNTNGMIKLRKDLENTEDLGLLISHGCSAHYLNLLGQDITPRSIMSHIVKVQKYFRNHHAPGAWLKECANSVKPQLPCETRWSSQLKCLESYISNHAAYLSITNEHFDKIDKSITDIIRNFNLHKQVKDLIQQLKPISVALDRLQKDRANIADATHEWLALLQNPVLKPHIQAVSDRFTKAILPHHMFAYLMHPRYKGERLSHEEKEIARRWIEEKNSDLLPAVILFETESSPYPKTYFNDSIRKTLDPITWWRGVSKSSDIPNELSEYIEILLDSPSSSAGLERMLSSFAFIHSKLRNRLKHSTAKKLLFCYMMLHCSKDSEYFDDIF